MLSSDNHQQRSWPGILGGGLFSMMGLLICGWFAQIAWQSWQSREWPSTPGVISSSYSIPHTDNRGRTHSHAEIYYDYSINGQSFQGSRVQFGGISTPKALHLYPRGASVRVYYDPLQPEQAILSKELDREDWGLMMLGLMIIAVGSTMIKDNL